MHYGRLGGSSFPSQGICTRNSLRWNTCSSGFWLVLLLWDQLDHHLLRRPSGPPSRSALGAFLIVPSSNALISVYNDVFTWVIYFS